MSVIDAILWRWPGAHVVTSGDTLVRWDGPMAQPSTGEIAQAITDYAMVAATVVADARTDALVDAISDDLLTAIAERMKATQDEVTAGTFQPRQWKQQIRGRVKALRRQRP